MKDTLSIFDPVVICAAAGCEMEFRVDQLRGTITIKTKYPVAMQEINREIIIGQLSGETDHSEKKGPSNKG